MRSQHIRALTGVRFFAAIWVVAYHSTRHNFPFLIEHHHDAVLAVLPVMIAGVRGVDLFFILSGFVLTLNYMDQLGPRVRLRPTLRFLWLRLARIWPLYMLVILGAAVLRVIRHDLWDSAPVHQLTWSMFARQALMVQQWFPPEHGHNSWVGPAWSLSAEWLAYLAFPIVVLVVARWRHRLRARTLFVLSGVVMVPLVVGISVRHDMGGHVWIARILCEFTAGMLLCAAVSRLDLTPRVRRIAGLGAIAVVIGIVLWLYAPRHFEIASWSPVYVVVLFVPLIACLAIGTGPLHDLLSTKALVLGGGLSYALYLVHSPMLYFFRDATHYTDVLYLSDGPRYYAELLYLPVIVFVAWLLYRYFEEPVRKLMRRMLDVQFTRATGPVPAPASDVREEALDPGSPRI